MGRPTKQIEKFLETVQMFLPPQEIIDQLKAHEIGLLEKFLYESCDIIKQQQERIDELEEGFRLYIILIQKQQFTPPETIKKISEITGKEYPEGTLIRAPIMDLEKILKGGD